jgi:hypothetical protein
VNCHYHEAPHFRPLYAQSPDDTLHSIALPPIVNMDIKQSERNPAHHSDEEKIPVEHPEKKDPAYHSDEEKIPVEHPEKARPKVEIPIYNDVERVDQTDLSFAAILKGTAANPLNTFEKKAALINVELDKFGMGKYQICIWFLCGFGYFLDLAWSQGVGLIASAIYQEVC